MADAGPEALLEQARDRIQQHRRGPGVILVKRRNGSPIPGAAVKIRQLRHEMRFGCNFFRFGRIDDPQREEAYRRRFAQMFNYATLGFYWNSYERRRGMPSHEATTQALDWCRRHGITCKGHPLAWDHPASSPRWLPDDLEEVARLSRERVRDCIRHFKGRLDIWDVVNEPTDLTRFDTVMNRYITQVGAVPFTREYLKLAREANPEATLLVNDYRTDPAYFKILDALRTEDKLMFDAVGIQSHMHHGRWPLQRVWEVCDSFARLGLPLHFTETTLVSGPRLGPGEEWGPTTVAGEKRQAEETATFYTMLMAHPAVEAITWWDFSDDGAWQGAPSGWLRRDMSPKPVYERMQALIKKEWCTDQQGRTDARGEWSVSPYYGLHRVDVAPPDAPPFSREVFWNKGVENRMEIVAQEG